MNRIAETLEERLKKMEVFSSEDDGEKGTTRLPFTPEAKEAAGYLAELMKEAGLAVRCDESGAVIGRKEGRKKETYIIASHYDSVENGGNYDGIAGVLCGIGIAGLLADCKDMEYSLEIVATNDEEGARFSGGFFSSKAMLGEWTVEELKQQKDKHSVSIYDAMKEYGLQPENIGRAKRNAEDIRGFFEIHIEQGPVLETNKKELGIVHTIVGMERRIITVYGRADHAGTTPMNMRQDAVEAAAKIIARIGDCARKYPDTVATVGYISVSPNAVNTIAGKVEFSLDVRSPVRKNMEQVLLEIEDMLSQDTVFSVKKTLSVEPVDMDEEFRQKLSAAAMARGYSWQEINSGAGHDSLPIGRVWRTAMLFVPSAGGRSHCPEEYTEPEALEKAVLTLYDVIKELLGCKEE